MVMGEALAFAGLVLGSLRARATGRGWVKRAFGAMRSQYSERTNSCQLPRCNERLPRVGGKFRIGSLLLVDIRQPRLTKGREDIFALVSVAGDVGVLE